jgi:hypothetical protein
MRVVIDTNRLTSSELMAFLMLSPNNRAVLTDFVAMEAYQPDANHHVLGNMRVVASFPRRVIVLKGTGEVATLDPTREVFPSAIIDREQTKGFNTFAEAMTAGHAGDTSVLAQINERRGWAKNQLALMLLEASDTDRVFKQTREMFSTAEWAKYARNEPLSREMIHTILRLVTDEAELMAAFHPNQPALPSQAEQMPNHFIWRLMLCRVLRIMRQVSGGARGQKPSQFRNDMVDAFIAVYATYFGGLMTSDGPALETYQVARTILSALGVKLARDYRDGTQEKVANLIDRQRQAVGGAPILRVGNIER